MLQSTHFMSVWVCECVNGNTLGLFVFHSVYFLFPDWNKSPDQQHVGHWQTSNCSHHRLHHVHHTQLYQPAPHPLRRPVSRSWLWLAPVLWRPEQQLADSPSSHGKIMVIVQNLLKKSFGLFFVFVSNWKSYIFMFSTFWSVWNHFSVFHSSVESESQTFW